MDIKEATLQGFVEIGEGECFDYENPNSKTRRGRSIRRLTPTECARLQTIPPWYKWKCSDSQAYRMLGNGWTVEVIKHFFSFLPRNWFETLEARPIE